MRKRSTYRPRQICLDTMAFVKETLEPIRTREECVTFKLRNHQALAALAKGHGTRRDVDVVIDALNVTEALARLDVATTGPTRSRPARTRCTPWQAEASPPTGGSCSRQPN